MASIMRTLLCGLITRMCQKENMRDDYVVAMQMHLSFLVDGRWMTGVNPSLNCFESWSDH